LSGKILTYYGGVAAVVAHTMEGQTVPELCSNLAEPPSASERHPAYAAQLTSGSESLFNNANPAFNRELFNEAHDFVIKTWTTPGPFRYEGKHYHYRWPQ
jgi:hypothetical protein